MHTISLGTSGIQCSEVSLGCMRIGGMEPAKLDELISTSIELGIDFFDHADIYGGGECERVFARSMARLWRIPTGSRRRGWRSHGSCKHTLPA